MYSINQNTQYGKFRKRIFFLPAYSHVGTGTLASNTVELLEYDGEPSKYVLFYFVQ